MTKIKMNKSLSEFIGTTIGYVKINKSYIHHNNSYECAAWWEDSEIQPGVYPVILQKEYLYPHSIRFITKLDAIVVDDYFPALFGGVRISNSHTPKNVGQKRQIHRDFEVMESINLTGQSASDDYDICISPFIWQEIVNAAREDLESKYDYLSGRYQRYSTEGDGKYNDNLSGMGYAAGEISKLAKVIEEINRKQGYMNDDYFARLHKDNLSWLHQAA